MAEVLGIDSGGTKTLAARADRDGNITFWHASQGLDPTGPTNADVALREILASCGTPAAATLGLPFHGEITDVTAQQSATAHDILGPNAKVMNDVAVAHVGAFVGGEGVLLLAGTGSMAWAVGPKGTHRAGGFGHIFGDEGSAYWIGREALAAASHEIDGRTPATGFADQLCAKIGIVPAALIEWTYSHADARPTIAALARTVSALSNDGLTTATAILTRAGDELAALGNAAARRAGVTKNTPWATGGSVFHDHIVTQQTMRRMGTPPRVPTLPPLGGAVLDAARRTGWEITDTWIATLARSIEAYLSQMMPQNA